MDSFTALEFSELQIISSTTSAATYDVDEDIRQFVDADQKVGYGGYCVIA